MFFRAFMRPKRNAGKTSSGISTRAKNPTTSHKVSNVCVESKKDSQKKEQMFRIPDGSEAAFLRADRTFLANILRPTG